MLTAVINPININSQKVVEKAGMSFVGNTKYYNFDMLCYEINKEAK